MTSAVERDDISTIKSILMEGFPIDTDCDTGMFILSIKSNIR